MNDYAPHTQIHSSTAASDESGTAISRDGTLIAYDRSGRGPAVVVIDVTFGSRTFGPNVKLPAKLSAHHTVFHYDRRGRGDSGDTRPYAVARELPAWARLCAAAETIVQDGQVMAGTGAGSPLPAERFRVEVPTLVIDGAKSPRWLHQSADAFGALLPNGERQTLAGQTHFVKPAAIAPALTRFFAA